MESLTEAFKQAGITKAEFTDYTWHHLDDFDPITGKTTIELVEISAYESTFPYAGFVSLFEKHSTCFLELMEVHMLLLYLILKYD